MAILVITHPQKKLEPPLPYQILLNGQLVGFMTTPQVQIQLPEGKYNISIRLGADVPIGKKGKVMDLSVSSSTDIQVNAPYTCLEFKNKERWWDILFSIDLILWLITLFFTIPHPWNIVYHVISDGFFSSMDYPSNNCSQTLFQYILLPFSGPSSGIFVS